MPATYAHYRFGDRCLGTLSPGTREMILRHRSLYDIGVHGPDLFFYYHPFGRNKVNRYGSNLHHLPGRTFFVSAAGVYASAEDHREEMLTYLLGFLAHYTLDSTCHSYVEEGRAPLGISHNRLEALLDADLLRQDGFVASKVNRGFSLHPTQENAEIISRFVIFNARTVLAAGRGQVSTMNLLYSPSGTKKKLLRGVLRLLHIPGHFDDLFIDDEIPADCAPAVAHLEELTDQALADFPILADNLMQYLNGEGDLLPRFDHDFE